MVSQSNIKEKLIQLFRQGIESNLILATSAGFGIFMGIIPFWGFQMLVAVAIAHVLNLNKPIVLLFSNISIPVMIPFILFASTQIGYFLLEHKWLPVTLETINWQFCTEIIWHYILGSVVLAIISGVVCFIVSWCLLYLFKK